MRKIQLIFTLMLALTLWACDNDESSDNTSDGEVSTETDNGEVSTSNGSIDESGIQEILNAHNQYRQEVNIDDLIWSDEVARSAQEWADHLAADNCGFYHSDSPFGENLWAGSSGFFTLADAVNSWGSEKENYTHADNSCSGVCGHYTQIVWEDSKSVGCAIVTCDGRDIMVCQYDPPGNFIGQSPY